MHKHDERILWVLARARLLEPERDGWMERWDIHEDLRTFGYAMDARAIYQSLDRMRAQQWIEAALHTGAVSSPYPPRLMYRITEEGRREQAKVPVRGLRRWLPARCPKPRLAEVRA